MVSSETKFKVESMVNKFLIIKSNTRSDLIHNQLSNLFLKLIFTDPDLKSTPSFHRIHTNSLFSRHLF